ncbi:mitochondrial carrier domain-containing protein [Radiomyces spectabilis]|uniref:mitochondrial carrier domain-containing protein n=1 Tax=Radiomyces spectabilis TaxID=64574 RepID=UPI00221F1D88|nr:mitochondrial carrier domain-containing protein [Radiomyces spectabilis]KAI8388176.1 mitochondrial carrier domain-containing protein [Radiomyces spectabilis]
MTIKSDQKNPFLHLSGGAMSGMVACIVLQPLDLIKTRLQQQRQDHLAFLREAKKKGLLVAPQNSTIVSTVRDIVRSNGPSGLWRGTIPTILRNVPGSALYFVALAEIRDILSRTRTTWQPWVSMKQQSAIEQKRWENLVSGASARGAVGYIMMPITVVKVRYESNFYNYHSMTEAFRSILKHDGVRGLFAGYGATFIRDAPFAGIYLFFYETCKSWANAWKDQYNVALPNMAVNLGSGVSAGMLATCVTQPFDLLKTRMQLKPNIYKNIMQSARKIYMEEGIIGFFDGISVRMIRKPLNSAISWAIYEEVVRWHARKSISTNEL